MDLDDDMVGEAVPCLPTEDIDLVPERAVYALTRPMPPFGAVPS